VPDAAAVTVRNLTKTYGTFPAVKGIDFDIHAGEVFGLLGPNGAGKTTTVEILEGLRPRSSGEVSVLGIDPARDSRQLKDRIGVCLQATHLADKISVAEALRLFASFYSRQVDAESLLKRLSLWDKRNDHYAKLSGGQQHAGASSIEHGPRDRISEELLNRLTESGTAYDPTLSVWDAQAQLAAGRQELLDRALVQQVLEPKMLLATRSMVRDRGVEA
jgi:ABC-2 type transport system ATP-binding protein